MQRKDGTTADQTAHIARIAWLVSFVVPLVLVVLLLLLALKPAHAATPGRGGAIGAPTAESQPGEPIEVEAEEPEEAPEEGCKEVEAEGGEAGEEVAEEVEAEEDEGAAEETGACEAGNVPPARCLLRSARARALVFASQNRVRLLVDYTSFAPARATVEYRLEGSRGSLKLGRTRWHLATKGLIRLSEKLSAAEMAKVRAANGFTVTMRIPAAPKSCDRYDSRHLTIRRTIHGRVEWLQSDSIFGTPR